MKKTGTGTEPPAKTAAELVSSNPLDPIDNNNHIAFVDQSDSVSSSPVRESPQSEEVLTKKPVTSKVSTVQEKATRTPEKESSKTTSSTPSSSGKPVSKTKKSEVKTPTRRACTQQKKDPGKPQEASTPVSQQRQQKSSSSAHGNTSSPAPKKPAPSSRTSSISSSSSKHRVPEKTISREGSKLSLGSDKACAGKPCSAIRAAIPKGNDTPADSRTVRSSSMASLRTPQTVARSSLKRDSKSEEKGLSFFKSALRQKENRRSADLGKTSLLSKKPTGTKSVGQEKPEIASSTPIAEVTPKKHSALPQNKAKSSPDERQAQSSPGGKKTADKYLKKFPSSSSSKPSPKAQ